MARTILTFPYKFITVVYKCAALIKTFKPFQCAVQHIARVQFVMPRNINCLQPNIVHLRNILSHCCW